MYSFLKALDVHCNVSSGTSRIRSLGLPFFIGAACPENFRGLDSSLNNLAWSSGLMYLLMKDSMLLNWSEVFVASIE